MLIIGATLPASISAAAETPQISLMIAENATETAINIVKSLNNCCVLTNSTISPAILSILAESIMKDYKFLHFGEIILALSNGCKGAYGQIFGQLNYVVIQSWLTKYSEERIDYDYNKHMNRKSDLTFGDSSRTSQPSQVDGIIRGLNAIGMKLK